MLRVNLVVNAWKHRVFTSPLIVGVVSSERGENLTLPKRYVL